MPINKYYATILLGAAELLGAFTSILLVHSTGKRPLVFASLIGVGCCFFATAMYANFMHDFGSGPTKNVIANYTSSHRSFANRSNFTQLTTDTIETTTVDFMTTTDFFTGMDDYYNTMDDSDVTTQTNRLKRHFDGLTKTNGTLSAMDLSDISPHLWVPLVLLVASGVFSHVGKISIDTKK